MKSHKVMLDYHDCEIENIVFDFKNQTIKISIMKYDDNLDDYKTDKLIFKNVRRIRFPIIFEEDINLEIFSFDITTTSNGNFAEIIILLGFSKPSVTFQFEFVEHE